mmetsp:Transcript_69197/g.136836  ORF Transcript_69197/g.136836 Transcript_69197/m.136836 type:complete len:124 (+) Transcript_69197:41-412(+)
MGSGKSRPQPDPNAQKVAFQQCVKTECVVLARRLMAEKSAASVSARFGMEQKGSTMAHHGISPAHNNVAQRQRVTGRDMLDCERRCAQLHWPAAEKEPWIGGVALEMAAVPSDSFSGTRADLK